MVCVAGLWLAVDKPPSNVNKKEAIRSAEVCAFAYAASGIVALVGYLYSWFTALQFYSGYIVQEVYRALWVGAKPSVLGVVLHIGTQSLKRMG